MKLVCFSDTHSKHKELIIPNGDILIFAGDFTGANDWELFPFLEWFGSHPHKYKIFVPGNHDWVCAKNDLLVKEETSKYDGMYYLHNSGIIIEGIEFWGTATQPKFLNWAFNYPSGTRKRHFNSIPNTTQILITHCPPFGILDKVSKNKQSVGCEVLLKRLDTLPNLKYHIFGHLHDGDCGIKQMERNGIKFINCSVLNDCYVLEYEPILVEV